MGFSPFFCIFFAFSSFLRTHKTKFEEKNQAWLAFFGRGGGSNFATAYSTDKYKGSRQIGPRTVGPRTQPTQTFKCQLELHTNSYIMKNNKTINPNSNWARGPVVRGPTVRPEKVANWAPDSWAPEIYYSKII